MKFVSFLFISMFLLGVREAGKASVVPLLPTFETALRHSTGNLDSALHYFRRMQSLALEEEKFDSLMLALKWKVQCAVDFGRYDLQRGYLEETEWAFGKFRNHWPPDLRAKLRIDLDALWAGYFLRTGQYEMALRANRKVLDTLLNRNTLSRRDSFLVYRAYAFTGQIYKHLGNLHAALRHYRESFAYIENDPIQRRLGRPGLCLAQMAECYQRLGRNSISKKLFKASLKEFLSCYPDPDPSIHFRLNKNLYTAYHNLGRFFLKTGMPDSALHYLERSLRLDPNPLVRTGYDLLGEAWLLKGDHRRSSLWLDKALERKQVDLGGRHYSLGVTYTLLGRLCGRQAAWTDAIRYFDRAIALHDGNPGVTTRSATAPQEWLEALSWKARAFYHLFQEEGCREYLTEGLSTTRRAISLMDIMRDGFEADWDKQLMLDRRYELFSLALEMCYAANPDDHDSLFELAENGKASVMLDAFRQVRFRAQAEIPAALLERERRLRKELVALKEDYTLPDGDPDARSRMIFRKQEEWKRAQGEMDTFRGTDYRRRIGEGGIPLRAARRLLGEDQALIEFFLGDSVLFVFCITPSESLVWRKAIDAPLDAIFQKTRRAITDPEIRASPEGPRLLQSLMGYWHELLLADPLSRLPPDITHLILVPDGKLAYLPFEAMHPPSEGRVDPPRVLENYAVSYAWSAGTLREQMLASRAGKGTGVGGFAPEYGHAFRESRFQELPELDGARRQVERSIGIWGGTAFLGKKASEQLFKEKAGDYQVLHLAMHSLPATKESRKTGLAFTPGSSDGVENDILFMEELGALDLRAELVVLSACNSGFGPLHRGEGVLSFSRAFAAAGARSVVMGQWKLPDKASSGIMEAFFRYLRRGDSKATALRQAKLDYLARQKGELARHPYFWAGCILSGNATALDTTTEPPRPGWILMGITTGLLLMLFIGQSLHKLPGLFSVGMLWLDSDILKEVE